MLAVTFDRQALDKILSLKGLTQKLEDVAEDALDQAAASILNQLRTNFLQELDPQGNPWIPSAAAQKRRAKGGSGTLFDTGRLFRSIQLSGEGNERIIGTDVPYAPYLHYGTVNMPARSFLDITEFHIALARGIFEFRIKEALTL